MVLSTAPLLIEGDAVLFGSRGPTTVGIEGDSDGVPWALMASDRDGRLEARLS